MNDATTVVLITELEYIADQIDSPVAGSVLLGYLEDMPKHIRTALAKRLMEDA